MDTCRPLRLRGGVEVLGAISWSVVKCVAKIVAIAAVVNGSFWEISKTKHCIWSAKAQVECRQRVVGGFAARPIFAAEFRRRTSLFPFSTNERQDRPVLRSACSFRGNL